MVFLSSESFELELVFFGQVVLFFRGNVPMRVSLDRVYLSDWFGASKLHLDGHRSLRDDVLECLSQTLFTHAILLLLCIGLASGSNSLIS